MFVLIIPSLAMLGPGLVGVAPGDTCCCFFLVHNTQKTITEIMVINKTPPTETPIMMTSEILLPET